MRLCGGFIFHSGFHEVPPPSGGAARFPSLETVKMVTSPAMPTRPRPCEYSAGGGQGAPVTTLWPFLWKGLSQIPFPQGTGGAWGVLQPPQWRGVLLIARYFGLRTTCPWGFYQRDWTQLETVQGTAGRHPLQSVWMVPRDNKVTINRASSLGPAEEGFLFDLSRYLWPQLVMGLLPHRGNWRNAWDVSAAAASGRLCLSTSKSYVNPSLAMF
jgi:hypothetical protein